MPLSGSVAKLKINTEGTERSQNHATCQGCNSFKSSYFLLINILRLNNFNSEIRLFSNLTNQPILPIRYNNKPAGKVKSSKSPELDRHEFNLHYNNKVPRREENAGSAHRCSLWTSSLWIQYFIRAAGRAGRRNKSRLGVLCLRPPRVRFRLSTERYGHATNIWFPFSDTKHIFPLRKFVNPFSQKWNLQFYLLFQQNRFASYH